MTSLCENIISKSNVVSHEHFPDFIANNYYTSWRTYFLTDVLLLLWGELILIASFLHFLQHVHFARGEQISVMKIPHVTRITSQTEHSWLWNSPQTPNRAYPCKKLESILKWKKDRAKCYLWALTLGFQWTHRVDTHPMPNRMIVNRKHHCSQSRPFLEVQLYMQCYCPEPR